MTSITFSEEDKELVVKCIDAYMQLLKDKAAERATENIKMLCQANLFTKEELKQLEYLESIHKQMSSPVVDIVLRSDSND